MRIVRLAALLGALLVAGCGDTLDPAALDATGHWTAWQRNADPEWTFDLVEAPDGSITGRWNSRQRYIGAVRGRRTGTEVRLVPDSPNLFHVIVEATFTAPGRMTGRMEADNRTYELTLRRS